MLTFIRRILSSPVLSLAARLTVGLVFIAAAVDKIAVPDAFAKSISNYQIMPIYMLHILAMTLPWIELLAGLMLVLGVRLRANAAIAGVLLLTFIAAISWALYQDYNINCGCFAQTPGAPQHKIGAQKIFENIGLTVLCVYIVLFPSSAVTLENLAMAER